MKRILLLSYILLLSAVWAIAQYDAGSQSNTDSGKMTVEGCLSGTAGNFSLTDKSTGTTYQLTGNTAKLQNHVGHTMQVTGTASAGTTNPAGSMSSSTEPSGAKTLNVTSFKHISATCTDSH